MVSLSVFLVVLQWVFVFLSYYIPSLSIIMKPVLGGNKGKSYLFEAK